MKLPTPTPCAHCRHTIPAGAEGQVVANVRESVTRPSPVGARVWCVDCALSDEAAGWVRDAVQKRRRKDGA